MKNEIYRWLNWEPTPNTDPIVERVLSKAAIANSDRLVVIPDADMDGIGDRLLEMGRSFSGDVFRVSKAVVVGKSLFIVAKSRMDLMCLSAEDSGAILLAAMRCGYEVTDLQVCPVTVNFEARTYEMTC